MNTQMQSMRRRWNDGSTTDVNLTFQQQAAHFRARGGPLDDVGLEWEAAGLRHFLPGRFFLLPDNSGVVTGCANNGRPTELIVLNADMGERFRLTNPIVDGEPMLSGGVHVELPREGWPAGRIPFGPIACWKSRPDLPVMLDLDWQTGQVLGFEPLPRFF